jgi:2-C-methyl-D-erythritol 4-phosphate cytidylyltransferase
MWRAVVLPWPGLPDAWHASLRAVVDEVAALEGEGYVVIDARCPGLDPTTVRRLVAAAADGRPRVGVRPVTDTVKRLRDRVVTGTVDRAGLVQVASPLVVPAPYGEPVGACLVEMAAALSGLVRVEVPSRARRMADLDELRVLEAAVE